METRATTLRRQQRRVFFWSFLLAVVAHAVVLFFGPWFRTPPLTGVSAELEDRAPPPFGGLAVSVIFGPPGIVDADSSISQEPAWRNLGASRVLPPPPACARTDWYGQGFAKGEVRLVVQETGRPDTVALSESTGDPCWDILMGRLASDLRYRWLPSERFPAPVELYQPVTLTMTGY